MNLEITHEDAFRWNVKCAEPGCTNVVTVPKTWHDHKGKHHTRNVPIQVRCVIHPPPPKEN